MIPFFQPSPNDASRRARRGLDDAFAFLIKEAAERDFTRIYDAIDQLRYVDAQLYQSLRAHYLTRAIFDQVDAEDVRRRSIPMQERLSK